MRMARVVGEIAFPLYNNGGNSLTPILLSCGNTVAHIDISMDSRLIRDFPSQKQTSIFRVCTYVHVEGFQHFNYYNKYFDTLSAQYIIVPSICIISIYEPNQHAFALVRQSLISNMQI